MIINQLSVNLSYLFFSNVSSVFLLFHPHNTECYSFLKANISVVSACWVIRLNELFRQLHFLFIPLSLTNTHLSTLINRASSHSEEIKKCTWSILWQIHTRTHTRFTSIYSQSLEQLKSVVTGWFWLNKETKHSTVTITKHHVLYKSAIQLCFLLWSV